MEYTPENEIRKTAREQFLAKILDGTKEIPATTQIPGRSRREGDNQPCDPRYFPISSDEINRTAEAGDLEEASRLYLEKGHNRELNDQTEFN